MKYINYKNLILVAVVALALASFNSASAYYNYDNSNYGYSSYGYSSTPSYTTGYSYQQNDTSRNNYSYYNPGTSVVNNTQNQNYYYQPQPVVQPVVQPVIQKNPSEAPVVSRISTQKFVAVNNNVPEQNTQAPVDNAINEQIPVEAVDRNVSNNNGNNLSALSISGSNSFMPNTIFEWVMTVIFILVIIILARQFRKREEHTLEAQTVHH